MFPVFEKIIEVWMQVLMLSLVTFILAVGVAGFLTVSKRGR
jgi:hypothetical protein